ncbi:MAG: hypothetical protein KBF93_20980 [Leptospiraceae bacterium]|nr:hypothetical protein [Leptospiraceae bacterium]
MNGNRELALSWFKTADEDILAAEHEIRYEDANYSLQTAYKIRSKILEKANI